MASFLQQIAQVSRPALEFPYILRTRRNHGLEHATIHMLNRQRYRLSGRSNDGGFVILGEVPTEKVEAAAHEALRRMKSGEHSLAVHPNCGTNLVTTSFLVTLVAALGFSGLRRRSIWDRFPTVMAMTMFAVLFSQPLGMSLQKHFTTEGDPGDMEIVSISRREVNIPFMDGSITVHQVVTKS